jgi:hypothetical protein
MTESRIPKGLNIKQRENAQKEDQDRGGNNRLGKISHKGRKNMGGN